MRVQKDALTVRAWVIGTGVLSIAGSFFAIYGIDRDLGSWVFSLLMAFLAYLCSADSRPGMRDTAYCVITVIIEVLVAFFLALFITPYVLAGFFCIHVVFLILFLLPCEKFLEWLRKNAGAIRKDNESITRWIYFGLCCAFYAGTGMWFGGVSKGVLTGLWLIAGILLCKILYWLRWEMQTSDSGWCVKRFGKISRYQYADITRIISIPIDSKLIFVAGRFALWFPGFSIERSTRFFSRIDCIQEERKKSKG